MEIEIPTDDHFDELDENGFPISPLSSQDEDDPDDAGVEGGEDSTIADASESISSFASDFYRSGSEWSCLLDKEPREEKKSLVQRDLFQMWGIKKPPEGSSSRVSSPPLKKHRANGGFLRNDRADRPRICPFYKKIPGTPFTVDAFRYGLIEGCSAYFLSHFHHDHYGGLNKSWSHGPIYCTQLTARLVKMSLSVKPLYICPLELDTEHIIEGIKVTMLEANHCPGAALIHFRLRDGRCYLHTGDFRACKLMQSHPLLLNQRINLLYLDTTYCNPKYRFPPKDDVVDFVVRITRDCLEKQPKTLIIVGAYSIGKEHAYLAISQALGVSIYTNASRRRILQSYGWPDLSGKLCSSGERSPLHVLPLSFLRPENLKEYLKTYRQQFTAVLAFRPTGVPYSEHSSFTELREFVQFLRPDKIIPTVNVGNAATRDKMQSYFREWLKA